MPGRIAALVLAFTVIGAPVMSTTCEAMCAERDAHSTAPHHACHEHMAAQDGPAVEAIHVCGHDDGSLPTDLERVLAAVDAPAIISAIAALVPPARELVTHVAFIDSSPPAPLTANSQLRI